MSKRFSKISEKLEFAGLVSLRRMPTSHNSLIFRRVGTLAHGISIFKKFLLFISLVLLSALACYNPFSPPVSGPGFMVPIALQTDPDSVLQNFKYAYEYRDIITYENCLDKGFAFYYIDQDRNTGELIEVRISRDEPGGDIDRTKGVFKVFDDIRFETWEVFPLPSEYDSSFMEERKVRQVNFHLVLRDIDGDFNYEHLEATGFALFKFRRSEDGFWRIVYWKDNSIQGL